MKIKNIKHFSEFSSVLLIIIDILIVFNLISGKVLGYSNIANETEGKIKVKITYSDNPNSPDFFELSDDDALQYIDIDDFIGLGGIWRGTYNLNENSIYWINPEIAKSKILKSINLGEYELSLKLISDEFSVNDLVILQDRIDYGPINLTLVKNKQINYWTTASNKDWLEVIRGKILRPNESELYTKFKTTVYDKGTPIYAFQGESILVKR